MRQRVLATYCLFAILAMVTVAACASAGLSLKQKALTAHQSVDVVLSQAHDFERQAYAAGSLPVLKQPASADFVSKCPQSQVALAANPNNHQVFACLFAVAFMNSGKAAVAAQAWKAGDPVPADVATLQKDATDVLTVVKQLVPGQSALADKVQAWVNAAAQFALALQGAK